MVDYEGIFGHIESAEGEEEISTGSINDPGELNEATLATLEKYKGAQDRKEKVNIKFTAISKKNNAFAMEDGVKIVLRYPLMSNELKQRVANGPVDALKMLVKGVDVMITGSSLHGTVPVVYASCTK